MSDILKFEEHGIVAIIRGQESESILPIIEALLKGGIRIVEITADTVGVTNAITKVVKEFGDDLFIGAGTVLDPETAKLVIQSGAQFVISPTVNPMTIKLTKRYGAVSIPGALTPTEMLTAFEEGADLIKLFPAGGLGANYIKDIHGPLSKIPIIATGGIDENNMEEYFQAGAAAVGIGSSLVKGNMDTAPDELEKLTSKAKLFVEEFQRIKGRAVL